MNTVNKVLKTQKIEKIKKKRVNFLKVQCFLKSKLMTRKQLADNNGVNNALITQKFPQKKKKIEKYFSHFFKSSMLSQVKFNNFEAISS